LKEWDYRRKEAKMKVRVCYDNGHDYEEFEYFSKYDRINARGIKDEILSEMFSKYGRKYKIVDFYRVED
jgi:hypothetical protein